MSLVFYRAVAILSIMKMQLGQAYNCSHIFKIAVPLVLGLVIQFLVGVTDTAFWGRGGEIELGASAIA